MKLLFLLFLIAIVGIVVYVYSARRLSDKKKKKNKWKPMQITAVVILLLLSLLAVGLYTSSNAPDIQCTTLHRSTTKPQGNVQTASDYFNQGNYDYDIGKCQQAVTDYTKAVTINPNYIQAYNNRAYTNMRMRNYKDALADLNKALQLNPNYIQALMNRGDIHNYYYQIDRQAAITDYEKVLSLGGTKDTSVCGHLFLARHNGWNISTFIDIIQGKQFSCQF